MELNDKLIYLRKRLGLSQEDVGRAVGVAKSTVCKWENGEIANMKRDKIALLAEVLKTTPAYLMDWDDSSLGQSAYSQYLFDTVSAIPFIRAMLRCCEIYSKPFDPIVWHYFTEDNFSCLDYLIRYSSLKLNDELFYKNYFNVNSLDELLFTCLQKSQKDVMAHYSREEINIIRKYRTLPDNLRDVVLLTCGLDRSSTSSPPTESSETDEALA